MKHLTEQTLPDGYDGKSSRDIAAEQQRRQTLEQQLKDAQLRGQVGFPERRSSAWD